MQVSGSLNRTMRRFLVTVPLYLLVLGAFFFPSPLQAQGNPMITGLSVEESSDAVELVVKGSEVLKFQSEWSSENVVLVFPQTQVAPDLAVPATNTPLVTGLGIVYDPLSGETRLELRLNQAKVIPVLSGDNRELRIKVVSTGTVPPDAISADESGFHTFFLHYAEPQSVADILKRLIPYGDNKVQVENGRHAIVVRDVDPQLLAEIQDFITEVDKPLPQVFLDAQIVEINADDVSKLGISTGSTLPTTFSEKTESYGSVQMTLQPIVRTPLSLNLTLDALKSDGKAQVLANPRVTTMDGVEAAVITGERFPIFVTETNGNQTFTIKQDIVAGIELKITPRVNEGDMITTKIRTQVSSITGVTGAGYPTTSTREATTTIRVRAGETIVIGGLRENREIKQATRVPFLGQIPWLGRLFSSERVEKRESELFIFVTPYLIK